MVSAPFFGGCAARAGGPDPIAPRIALRNNTEIAALMAPRRCYHLGWEGLDHYVPDVEYPFLQKVYAFYERTANVAKRATSHRRP